MHHQEWGEGDPLIAVHPLALESTAFAGAARQFARLGLRTLAVDLPGFGKTPIVEESLTPAALARPVIELAKSLERPPILLGMSLGGRVALEVALREPQCIRGLVMVAPYLPWRRYRRAVEMAEHLDPEWAYRLPLERAWPILQHTSRALDALPRLEHDWFARACVRVAYYLTCPDTRVAFLSAARELAIDPAYGPEGTWTRLAKLEVPTSFLWAGRDGMIPSTHAADVADAVPHVPQLEVACSGHFVNFIHYRCMEKAMALAVTRMLEVEVEEQEAPTPDLTLSPCLAGQPFEEEPPLEMVEFDD
jgi:pimeloyl-ACP methyl ester carboxylesterase